MLRTLIRRWITDRETRQRDQYAALLALVGVVGAALTLVFLILSQFAGVPGAIGLGGVILCSSAAAGAALGFLFSVPRVLSVGDAGKAPPEVAKGTPAIRLLGSNTNLERISEWLTTMIVGVGLSQITSISAHMGSFAQFLETHSTKALAAAGPFILIVGVVGGFVFLYLYTRLYLSPLFLYVEKLISKIGDEEVPDQEERIRAIAKELAGKDGGSVMHYIANVETISLDQTMHVLTALLYEDGGYRTVIDIGEDLDDTVAAQMARFWYIMAAAQGQRHHHLLEVAASDAERAQAYKAVLDASRKAVSLDASYKRRLADLSKPDVKDNDLQDFAADAQFKRLVR